ncbi:hypothetical protein AKO1_010066 [Acrasis kona]|uniref:Uncharacterized protein n=1 Tax=Acrasis kona TaxID=1008807 RepID=A0AAW2ZRW7_9EUKA
MSIRDKQFEAAKTLLLYKADICGKVTAKGCTPLHAACESGNFEAVQFLLKKGASLMRLDRNNETCLFLSLHNPRIVRKICEASIKQDNFSRLITSTNDKGWNIFHSMSESDNTDVRSFDFIKEYVINKSYSLFIKMINTKDKKNLNTPLHHAIKCKRTKIVEAICTTESCIHFDAKNIDTDTPLMLAIRCADDIIRNSMVDFVLNADKAFQGLCIINNKGLNAVTLAQSLQRDLVLDKLSSKLDQLDVYNQVDHITKEIEKVNFTCMVFLNDDPITLGLTEQLNMLADGFYSANCPLLCVVHYIDEDQAADVRGELNLRVVNDPDRSVLSQFGTKGNNLMRRLSLFMTGVERRCSLTSSPPKSPTSNKMSYSPPSSPSKHVDVQLSINSGEAVQSIVLLDTKGVPVYCCKRPDPKDINDIVKILCYYINGINSNYQMLHHSMEQKNDIFEWIFQNDYIVKQFIAQVTGSEWKQVSTSRRESSKLSDAEMALLYQEFIKNKEGDLSFMVQYNSSKKHNEKLMCELKKEAFRVFVQTQQFVVANSSLCKSASYKDMSVFLRKT